MKLTDFIDMFGVTGGEVDAEDNELRIIVAGETDDLMNFEAEPHEVEFDYSKRLIIIRVQNFRELA